MKKFFLVSAILFGTAHAVFSQTPDQRRRAEQQKASTKPPTMVLNTQRDSLYKTYHLTNKAADKKTSIPSTSKAIKK